MFHTRIVYELPTVVAEIDMGPYAWSTNSDVNGTVALTYR